MAGRHRRLKELLAGTFIDPDNGECDINFDQDVAAQFSGELAAYLRAFGNRAELLKMAGSGEASKEGSSGASIGFYVGGNLLAEKSWVFASDTSSGGEDSGSTECGEGNGVVLKATDIKEKEWELFNFKTRFQIGPVPVSVSVGASGAVGIEYGPDLRFSFPDFDCLCSTQAPEADKEFLLSAGLMFEPYLSLDLWAEAAVDAVVVAFGVRVDLNIIHLSFPFRIAFEFNGGLGYAAPGYEVSPGNEIGGRGALFLKLGSPTLLTEMYAKLRMLDGKLSVFFRLDLGFWEKTWTKKVAGWSGPKKEWKLLGYELKLGDGWDLGCTLGGALTDEPAPCPVPSWID